MTYNFKKKFIISTILTGVIFYFIIWPLLDFYKHRYKAVFDHIEEYSFMFKDSVVLNSYFSGIGQYRDTDRHYSYLTKNGYHIEFFEYTELNNISLNSLKLNYLESFPDYEKWHAIQLNYDLSESPIITTKNILPFNNHLYVDINKNAPIELIKSSDNYHVYYGSLTKMLLSGENKEPLVYFDFINVPKTIITFYRMKDRFLIIVISSTRQEITEETIELLNLEQTYL